MKSSKPNKESNLYISQLKDEALLGLLEQDSAAAFEELYIRYKEKLKTFCVFILKSETVAEDMVQEIFIKIWLGRRMLNTGQSFSHYLYTLAKNQSLNELRSAKRKELMENILIIQQNELSDATAETRLIFDEYQQMLEEAIRKLPDQKKLVYLMSREEGLSHREIAVKMGLSPHTIQTHISDSLRFIKEYFSQHADVELYAIFIVLWWK